MNSDELKTKIFIDGNFIEMFLDIDEQEQIKIVNSAKEKLLKDSNTLNEIGVREVRMLIEHLRQSHQ